MKVLVTGASGFVGAKVVEMLVRKRHDVIASSRSGWESFGSTAVLSPDLAKGANWARALQGTDAVVHLAGLSRAGLGRSAQNSYLRINSEGTRELAIQSLKAGVKHFLFMSSAHAVASDSERVLSDQTPPRPTSSYGVSKLAAENAVVEVLSKTSCSWSIFRPTAVYGPGNQANIGKLLRLVRYGVPLPFGSVRNRRSFIFVENLAHLIEVCLGNTRSFGKVYFPSDGEDVSTPELIGKIAVAAGLRVKSRSHFDAEPTTWSPVFPFPVSLLKGLARLPAFGLLDKLVSSLFVDSAPLYRDLRWSPPLTMSEGLRRTLAEV